MKSSISGVEFSLFQTLPIDEAGNTAFIMYAMVWGEDTDPRVQARGDHGWKCKFHCDGSEFTPDWVHELLHRANLLIEK
jgi:hypothetical protein